MAAWLVVLIQKGLMNEEFFDDEQHVSIIDGIV